MAMIAGTVTVDDDGTETKSGMAESIYDALITETETQLGVSLAIGTDGAPARQGIASAANGIATGVVTYITSNADVIIGTGDSALQRDNTGGNPSTLGPSAIRTLSSAIS